MKDLITSIMRIAEQKEINTFVEIPLGWVLVGIGYGFVLGYLFFGV